MLDLLRFYAHDSLAALRYKAYKYTALGGSQEPIQSELVRCVLHRRLVSTAAGVLTGYNIFSGSRESNRFEVLGCYVYDVRALRN